MVAMTACGGRPQPRVSPPPSGPAPSTEKSRASLIRVRTVSGGRPITLAMPIEDYVLASVLSEVAPPTGETGVMMRVYQLQAIVARTYATANRGRHASEGFDLCDTTHCQLVDLERPTRSRWANLARAAVTATRGRLLYFDRVPAAALYHADCGGYRASAAEVWGGAPVPYLTSEPDPLPGGAAHMAWTFSVGREKLRAALNANPRTAVGERLDTIDVQVRDGSGRARLVLLNGTRAPVVRGEDFRAAVAAALGPRTVRSSRFEVRREGDTFTFAGQGFGHGVGLCQAGAIARAAAGQSVEDILTFYYPHTRLR
jgi:stage II sporulation protein D (peptidoglycan lytic transglycosylase)